MDIHYNFLSAHENAVHSLVFKPIVVISNSNAIGITDQL